MNGTQKLLCNILSDSMDHQDHLSWHEREWNRDKWNAYVAACISLRYEIKNSQEVLYHILRCFCDAEGGDVQADLVHACESYCENPWDNEIFIREVIKAAPAMLMKSPLWYGDFMISPMMTVEAIKQPYGLEEFQALTNEEQQVIVNYLAYRAKLSPDNIYYVKGLADWLVVARVNEADVTFFREYL